MINEGARFFAAISWFLIMGGTMLTAVYWWGIPILMAGIALNALIIESGQRP